MAVVYILGAVGAIFVGVIIYSLIWGFVQSKKPPLTREEEEKLRQKHDKRRRKREDVIFGRTNLTVVGKTKEAKLNSVKGKSWQSRKNLVVICRSCGAKRMTREGLIVRCKYCDSPIEAPNQSE